MLDAVTCLRTCRRVTTDRSYAWTSATQVAGRCGRFSPSARQVRRLSFTSFCSSTCGVLLEISKHVYVWGGCCALAISQAAETGDSMQEEDEERAFLDLV